eukprot:321996_1
MAEEENKFDEKQKYEMAIEHLCKTISIQFPQYPEFQHKFKEYCIEEAFEDIDVLVDDFADGFNESAVLENITQHIEITDNDKESLCSTIYHILSTFDPVAVNKITSISFHLVDIFSNLNFPSKDEISYMANLVTNQVNLLEVNTDSPSILNLLILGQKCNLSLLSYLVDMYHRYRISQYIYLNHKKNIKLKDFNQACITIQELTKMSQHDSKIKQILSWYNNAMKACMHRNSLFYPLPLGQLQISYKIDDSLQLFSIYTISILKSVNQLINKRLIKFPTQIDVWFIPKNMKDVTFEDSDDTDNKQFELLDLNERLIHTTNLQTNNIMDTQVDALCMLFENVIQNVIKQSHKRMLLAIDRRQSEDTNILHAYLTKTTQNIATGNYLQETMINLTKLEILPSVNGDINEHTISANNETFVISLHMHKKEQITMYWHYCGSITRFFMDDMIKLWPSYFTTSLDNYHYKIMQKHIKTLELDQIIDTNFNTFYEINSKTKPKQVMKHTHKVIAKKVKYVENESKSHYGENVTVIDNISPAEITETNDESQHSDSIYNDKCYSTCRYSLIQFIFWLMNNLLHYGIGIYLLVNHKTLIVCLSFFIISCILETIAIVYFYMKHNGILSKENNNEYMLTLAVFYNHSNLSIHCIHGIMSILLFVFVDNYLYIKILYLIFYVITVSYQSFMFFEEIESLFIKNNHSQMFCIHPGVYMLINILIISTIEIYNNSILFLIICAGIYYPAILIVCKKCYPDIFWTTQPLSCINFVCLCVENVSFFVFGIELLNSTPNYFFANWVIAFNVIGALTIMLVHTMFDICTIALLKPNEINGDMYFSVHRDIYFQFIVNLLMDIF